MIEREQIVPINIEDEMKTAYIDYSMSVIVSRALPDVRDGLKPVHRRVLYGMTDLGLAHNRPYKKSARIVGEVLGKYHPHGDSSVYDTMVRLAQDWSMRYTLVDGQGNFGSVDGDPPAAMRYTEARLTKIAEEMLVDIDKNTVDYRPNFDDSLKEPTVLPAKVPNLLLNGAAGIAVGMATNMPPHNLREVVDATIAFIQNKDISIDELMQYIKGPDFPTGGTIFGIDGVRKAFHTGRGSVNVRGKAEIETDKAGRERIIITEIPYLVNKAIMQQKMAELVNEKVIEGISEIRDESDRRGMRVVIELKRDAMASVVLNKLYKYTQLQGSFSVNNVALVDGKPYTLNLKDLIKYYVKHRHEVVVRRTQFDLEEALKRAHILEGLLIALDHLDEVIALIRASNTVEEARTGLMERFALSELQARAILDMRLQKLTGLERDKIKAEYDELMGRIAYYREILANEALRMKIITDELTEIKEKYGDDRRTSIEMASDEISIEDLINNEEVVVTISHLGYVKRTLLTEFRTQGRGGKGSKGAASRDADFIEHIFTAFTHDYLLVFTEKGRCFWLRIYEIPEGNKTTKGRAVQNLIQIAPDDKIRTYLAVNQINDEDYLNNNFVVFCTKKGVIKKTTLEAYSRPRANGINAISINDDDQLLSVCLTNGESHIMIATREGQAIHFPEETVRAMGRTATGVRGVRLGDNPTNEVVGMICVQEQTETVMVVSENGYGKRSSIEDYRITNRGGKGVKTINITEKTGSLIGVVNVKDDDDLMIINQSGVTIRLRVNDIRVAGRNTQGVRLISLKNGDSISSITRVPGEKEEAVDPLDGGAEDGPIDDLAGDE
ncbi:MAG: DNA gyrase subunit A [Bacteroidetes bacterium]|jgi:DNA gyrase subunit A|nr:DNA gyrase subunit A [Bacteroidota bacterium]